MAGLPVTETLPNGKAISRDYHRLGRLGGGQLRLGGRRPSRPSGKGLRIRPDGRAGERRLRRRNRVHPLLHCGRPAQDLRHGTAADPGSLADFEYDYHEGLANNGRIMRIEDKSDPSKSRTYAYDEFNRLLVEKCFGNEEEKEQ